MGKLARVLWNGGDQGEDLQLPQLEDRHMILETLGLTSAEDNPTQNVNAIEVPVEGQASSKSIDQGDAPVCEFGNVGTTSATPFDDNAPSILGLATQEISEEQQLELAKPWEKRAMLFNGGLQKKAESARTEAVVLISDSTISTTPSVEIISSSLSPQTIEKQGPPSSKVKGKSLLEENPSLAKDLPSSLAPAKDLPSSSAPAKDPPSSSAPAKDLPSSSAPATVHAAKKKTRKQVKKTTADPGFRSPVMHEKIRKLNLHTPPEAPKRKNKKKH